MSPEVRAAVLKSEHTTSNSLSEVERAIEDMLDRQQEIADTVKATDKRTSSISTEMKTVVTEQKQIRMLLERIDRRQRSNER